jgi:hypothetical protein
MLPWNNFPFNEEMKKMLHNKGSTDIDQYVQDMITKMLPQNMDRMLNPQTWMKGDAPFHQDSQPYPSEDGLQAAIFETHDFVFIRIPIKDESWLRDIKIFHTSHELFIENAPSLEEKNTYTLPVPVRKKGATANLKDSILEIRIPRSIQTQISEISIPEI